MKYTCNTALYTQCKHNQITTHKIIQYTLYIVKYTLCKHAEITVCKIEKYTSNTMLYAQVFTQCKNPRIYIVNTQSWSPPYIILTHFYANEFTTWLHCVYIICKIDVSATPPQRHPPWIFNSCWTFVYSHQTQVGTSNKWRLRIPVVHLARLCKKLHDYRDSNPFSDDGANNKTLVYIPCIETTAKIFFGTSYNVCTPNCS